MAAGEDEAQFSSLKLNWKTFAGIGAISTVYFADLFLKASRKCFWFDELFTIYLCRLPNFKSTWTAVTHGADFNPPLFYLLTRGAQRLFGEGLIATRLPAMLGVWLFGVMPFCLRCQTCGCSLRGLSQDFFLSSLWLSFMPTKPGRMGSSLGWCGLALVCWQRSAEGRAKNIWSAGFGLSLACAC